MLQFIVLGLVPGTDIQLNLSDVLRIAATLLLIVILRSKLRSFKINPKITFKLFQAKTLSRKT